jgi:hypothetical protein
MKKLTIDGKLWVWQGPSAWYFLPTTKEQGAMLRAAQKGKRRTGFGSLRVRATIGKTAFDTSLFPTKDGPYLLPVKASVRKAEGLYEKSKVVATCVFL